MSIHRPLIQKKKQKNNGLNGDIDQTKKHPV